MATNKVKEYSNGEVTIVWKPDLCIHSGVCTKMLPQVYDPKARPWVKPNEATTDELINQVNHCPSGALSFYMNEEAEKKDVEATPSLKVEVLKDGPLMVFGDVELKDKDGSKQHRKKSTAFCRCGSSSNKPFCDGSHKKIGFTG